MTTLAQKDLSDVLVLRDRARRRQTIIKWSAALAAAAALAASSLLLRPINTERRNLRLVLDPQEIQAEVPPDVALLTTTLGAFRGMLIPYFWQRRSDLQEEGKYYELKQLSDWICKLEPHYPEVWRFNAWNMAYNISVGTYTPEERWRWVYNGIKLLRDEGIPLNPKSIRLYRELSWIYLHKMGEYLDDFHLAYKKYWAVMMQRVLGPPVVGADVQADIDAFKVIVDAPRPGAISAWIESQPAVREYVDALAEVGFKPDLRFLEEIARRSDPVAALAGELVRGGENEDVEARRRRQATSELMTGAKYQKTRDSLVAVLRSRELRENFRLDIDHMLMLMEALGPLDWRSVFSHGLYWANYGDKMSMTSRDRDPSEWMNLVRNELFTLWNMCYRGRVILEPDYADPLASYLDLLSDTRFIDQCHALYIEQGAIMHVGDPTYRPGTAGQLYETGHFNFLRDAIRFLYFEGMPESRERAEFYYGYLRQYNTNLDGSAKPELLAPIDEFVMSGIYDAVNTFKTAVAEVESKLYSSFYQTAIGRLDSARQFHDFAAMLWVEFNQEKWSDRLERRKMKPFDEMRQDSLTAYLVYYPLDLILKARLWRNLDLNTQQAIYDRAAPALRAMCDAYDPPLDADAAFSEPPGMEQYRREHPTKTEETGPDAKPSEGTKF